MAVLRLIEHHRDAEFRVIRRKKTHERSGVFSRRVNAIDYFLRGPSLASDGVAIQRRFGCRAIFRGNQLQRLDDLFGSILTDHLANRLRMILRKDRAVLILQTIDDHRPHQLTLIRYCRHSHDHLQMRHAHRLAHRHPADHQLVILELVHPPIDLAPQRDPRPVPETKGLDVIVELLLAQLVDGDLG